MKNNKQIFLKGVILLTLVFAFTGNLYAQALREVKINEILVKNVDNYADPYAHKIGWIELHNPTHTSVDVGGCILSVEYGNEDMSYPIPKGDPRTIIPPLGYVVFFADGTDTKGVFHTNFTLDQTGKLYLLDASGRRPAIDSLFYDVDAQVADISIGRFKGEGDDYKIMPLKKTTPLATNEIVSTIPKHERFRRIDPYGIMLTVTAMGVVFSALLFLYLIFRTIGKLNIKLAKRKEEKAASKVATVATEPKKADIINVDFNSETIAAIAYAIKQYEEDLHDIENTVITINRVAKAYSPWSSKIYGLRQTPNRR